MSAFRVSVVIPTFNRSALTERAVRSAARQTCAPTEIVVVDDGSTDDTKEVICRACPDVRYVCQTNAGPATARSRGIREAKGDWIAFLDSDDEWFPHKLERQISILTANPSLRWCAANYEVCSSSGKIEVASQLSKSDQKILSAEGCFPSFFEPHVRESLMYTSATVIRRDVFDEVGDFMPGLSHGEDTELWLRIAGRYPALGYCVEPCLRKYLGTPQSLCRNADNRRDILKALNRIVENARSCSPPIQNKVLQWCRRRAFISYLHFIVGRPDASAAQLAEWHDWVPPGSWFYVIATCVRYLPGPLARPVAHRLRTCMRYLERQLCS